MNRFVTAGAVVLLVAGGALTGAPAFADDVAPDAIVDAPAEAVQEVTPEVVEPAQDEAVAEVPEVAFVPYTVTARWQLPASWNTADVVPTAGAAIWDQSRVADETGAACDSWEQRDTYLLESPAEVGIFESLGDTLELQAGGPEDRAIYQSHEFVYGGDCEVVVPPVVTPPAVVPPAVAPPVVEVTPAATVPDAEVLAYTGSQGVPLWVTIAAIWLLLSGIATVVLSKVITRMKSHP